MLTAVTAEAGDDGSLGSITISGAQTSGTGTISTAQDDDSDDETFTAALGALPSSVTAGSPASVTVTITDDDPTPVPALPRVGVLLLAGLLLLVGLARLGDWERERPALSASARQNRLGAQPCVLRSGSLKPSWYAHDTGPADWSPSSTAWSWSSMTAT